MSPRDPDSTKAALFVTLVSDDRERKAVDLLIKSKRAFAGALAYLPLIVFSTPPFLSHTPHRDSAVEWIPMELPDTGIQFLFWSKVLACKLAEQKASHMNSTLIWIDPVCLLLQQPDSFLIDKDHQAAFRPVHLRNIGQSANSPVDDYWKRIYSLTNSTPPDYTIKSFADDQELYPYFNTHCFSLNPQAQICSIWWDLMEEIVQDAPFMEQFCTKKPAGTFLFQAVLSALLTSRLKREELLILPPGYSYPYHLQPSIPPMRRIMKMNDLTCMVYEEVELDPDKCSDITIDEPLFTWLKDNYTNA